MEDFTTIELSELDQIMPRLYVRWLLCLPLSQDSPKHIVINLLRSGVKSTLNALPILRGNIAPKPSDSSRVEVRVPKEKSDFELSVQHHDDGQDETFPTYESLKRTEFSVSWLPDKLLTPKDSELKPVFDLMATFIRGGLLLCVKCHHAVTDGAGLGLIVKLLARNCYAISDPSSIQEPIKPPSVDRSVLPRRREIYSAMNIGFNVAEREMVSKVLVKEYTAMISYTFKFPSDALKALKDICTIDSQIISTQDALTALLYGAVSYARAVRFSSRAAEKSTLPSVMGIAVNGRGRLNPAKPDYAGNLTLYATFSSPILLPTAAIPSNSSQDIEQLSERLKLPLLASQSRAAITAVTHDFIISTISVAASLQDVSELRPSFSDFYQGMDFFITSGADFPVFEQEWWPGGNVDALRIPLKGQWDGSSAVLATKDKSKGLDVLLGLREDDMAVVKDILFTFGAYIV